MREYLRKIAVCALILQKCHQNQSAAVSLFLEVMFLVLFWQFRGNLSNNGAWSALIWKNAPNIKWNAVIFFGGNCLECFSGRFGEIWAKILRIPKICLLLHPCRQQPEKDKQNIFAPPGKFEDAHDYKASQWQVRCMFGRRQQGIRKRGGPAIVMLGDIRKGAGILGATE